MLNPSEVQEIHSGLAQMVESRLLNETFLSDGPSCQSPNAHDPYQDDNVPCSGEVTHRIHTECGMSALVCVNAAQRAIWIQNAGNTCRNCGDLASECWHVDPWG